MALQVLLLLLLALPASGKTGGRPTMGHGRALLKISTRNAISKNVRRSCAQNACRESSALSTARKRASRWLGRFASKAVADGRPFCAPFWPSSAEGSAKFAGLREIPLKEPPNKISGRARAKALCYRQKRYPDNQPRRAST